MIGSNLLERRSKPERIADQAWRHLTSAVNSAGDSVRDTARSARLNGLTFADDAGDLVGGAAEEARRRAVLAFDALAGRRPALPWALLIGAALAGAAIGWAAGSAARAVGSRSDRDPDDIEFVDVDRPNSPAGLDT
ncbi:hypothetical protein [Micromonospora sagamiensis]|uniref:ElaB/YqjD/DUF883 family membrane-anchored ribosome-binding protein n=1 Tax=Micromonospora sagamiensis TaxID=47875 RepID=A0A562WC82_9ACTN|nr:hypothetical protein [Micromonospora sagamiensis]TWJ27889.1 hypothetical protein JD81_01389 [Micromonospora sagamiensis]BCL13221.1 hypothetical protein GCM10017556_09600 [Micromonospora sagamiensis]